MTRDERQEINIVKIRDDIVNKHKATLLAVTGYGKTRVALKIIQKAKTKNPNIKFQIIVPTDLLRTQWKSEVDCPVDTWQSLYKSKPIHVDFLIIDEVHLLINTEEYIRVLKVFASSKMIALTATLDETHYKAMEKYGFPISDIVTREEAEQNNWINTRKEYNVKIHLDYLTSKNLMRIETNLRDTLLYLDPKIEDFEEAQKQKWRYGQFKNLRQLNTVKFIGYRSLNEGIIYIGDNNPETVLLKHYEQIKFYKSGEKKGQPYKVMVSPALERLAALRNVPVGTLKKAIADVYSLQAAKTKLVNNNTQRLKVLRRIVELHPEEHKINFTMSQNFADLITEKIGGLSHHSGLSVKQRKINAKLFDEGEASCNMLNSVSTAKEGADFKKARISIHHGYNTKQYQKVQKDGRVVRQRDELLDKSIVYNLYMAYHPQVNNGESTYELKFLNILQKNNKESPIWLEEKDLMG